jgi:hypothetical protein
MSLLSETNSTVFSSAQLNTNTINAGVVITEGLAAQMAVLHDLTTTNLASTNLASTAIELSGKTVVLQSQIVAGGSQGDVVFSTDGINFVTVSAPNNPAPNPDALFKGSVNDVAADGEKWIAVANQALGVGPIMGISYNGYGWAAHPSPPGPLNTLTTVAYLNNLWLCGGQDSSMFYSLDGFTWTACTGQSVGSYVKSFAYGQGKWVVVGSPGFSGVTQAYSLDGISWTPAQGLYFTGAGGFKVASSATLFVAYGNDNYGASMMRVSTDGITWGLANTPPPTSFGYSVAVNASGTMWVSSGELARLYYSTDGLNWINSNFTNVAAAQLIWDGVKFVAVGQVVAPTNKDTAISYDGIHWSLINVFMNERAACITINPKRGNLALD